MTKECIWIANHYFEYNYALTMQWSIHRRNCLHLMTTALIYLISENSKLWKGTLNWFEATTLNEIFIWNICNILVLLNNINHHTFDWNFVWDVAKAPIVLSWNNIIPFILRLNVNFCKNLNIRNVNNFIRIIAACCAQPL